MNVTLSNSLWKLVFLGLIGFQTVQIVFLPYVDRVFENLNKTINVFKKLKISWQLEKTEATENLERVNSVGNKWLGYYFRRSKLILYMKNVQKAESGLGFRQEETMNVTFSNSFCKLDYLDLIGAQIVQIIFLTYVGRAFENLNKKINVSIYFKISGVSRFSFWAIDLILKDRNDGKSRKPHFNWT